MEVSRKLLQKVMVEYHTRGRRLCWLYLSILGLKCWITPKIWFVLPCLLFFSIRSLVNFSRCLRYYLYDLHMTAKFVVRHFGYRGTFGLLQHCMVCIYKQLGGKHFLSIVKKLNLFLSALLNVVFALSCYFYLLCLLKCAICFFFN